MAKALNSKEVLKKFDSLPKFPDGRINYSNSKEAATVNVFVVFDGKLLILRRSDRVGNYKGKWNIVAGYYDEPKPAREKALEEAREEIRLDEGLIEKIKVFPCEELIDNNINKIFYVFPVLIKLKSQPDIKLDWEHTEYRWVRFDELKNFDTVYKLEDIFRLVTFQ